MNTYYCYKQRAFPNTNNSTHRAYFPMTDHALHMKYLSRCKQYYAESVFPYTGNIRLTHRVPFPIQTIVRTECLSLYLTTHYTQCTFPYICNTTHYRVPIYILIPVIPRMTHRVPFSIPIHYLYQYRQYHELHTEIWYISHNFIRYEHNTCYVNDICSKN